MGVNQINRLGDYVRLMRNNAAEVQALADDLLIHVTGFFRDPAAWESLRERVIDPMIAGREADQGVRCWVTACSSGEEAYTLAMLIAESMERFDKRLDVKVFATDMAERSLVHARAGSFPLGIEGEVSPERLERFFDRDDSMYRVKNELREMVVFAPQNVLQDPPFSRLDVCTCRNLLIYLEPEMQRRVLSLIHFGLRDTGALLLGTSETVGGVDELFVPVDKKWRIYRRVGPTRHGQVEFPLPRVLTRTPAAHERGAGGGGLAPGAEGRATQRLSVAHLTERALLQRYTPAAVVVDREFRVVFFHGPTDRFLVQPSGEPTRELLVLARDTVRGAVRAALTQAIEGNGLGEARDGTITTDDGVRRVWVSVAPLETRPPAAAVAGASAPGTGHLLVTFEQRADGPPAALPEGLTGTGDEVLRLGDELARARDELQSTIEELQTSNEELKASNEEVMSVNEELQSSNEELETSKEELQSLNEELTTVNAQLQSKNEELQATSSDMQSLLSSTEIGVIFLDTRMRIRRFTPAARDLLDLISSDVGRPLADLHRKFEDDRLIDDARAVLEKLVPIMTEVRAVAGKPGDAGGERWYQRRITPYRTRDDRIEGVVVAFIDVTERRRAQAEVAEARKYAESIVETLHEPLLVLNPDLTVRSANAAFYRHFKVSPGETRGRKVYDLGNGQWDIPALRTALEQVLPTNRVFDDYEVSHTFQDIGHRVMLLNGRRLDQVQLILLGVRDVTEGHRADQAVRVSEERFRAVADLVPDLLWENDPSGATTWCNRRWTAYTGQTPEQARGYGWLEVIHPDDRVRSRASFQKAADDGQPLRQEHRIRRSSDGVYRWFLVQVVPVHEPGGGRIVRWLGSATDVHEQRTALDALGGGEVQFRGLVEGVQDFAIFLTDPQNRITLWNRGAEQIMGWTAAEAVGEDAAMIFTPEDRAAHEHEKEIELARRAGRAPNIRWHLKKDGSRFFGNGVLTKLPGEAAGFVKIMRDETDRKRTEDELERMRKLEEQARAAAEQANRTKDEFLATASHELRTPLSAILIWSKSLRRAVESSEVDRESLAEATAAIEHSAVAQKRLIEDLLDTVRIEAGKLRLHLQDCELPPVVRAAVEAMRPAAAEKNVTLGADVGADTGVVRCDAGRVEQVVWNLVSNAVKFTPAGGRVDVTVRRAADVVEIRVSDNGIGIGPDLLPHIFERFSQGEGGLVRASGGLGLGLTISRQLVELHGGTIEATSAGRNRGTTFTVRLPLPVVKRRKK